MTTVSAPARGDTWFGVEVVRGDGVVLEAIRFEPEARLWDEVVLVDMGYGYGPGDPGAGYVEPAAQGCRRR